MTNEQLIKNCLKGNARAQKMLYEKFGPKLMTVCYRYADDTDEAKDFLQEGFIKIFENLNQFSGTGSIEGWMRRIVVNSSLDLLRKNKKFQLNSSIDETEYKLISTDYIEERLAAEDLMNLLHGIPVGYRTVFNLYAIEGFSHKEIAKKLAITTSTSKSQYSRAKAMLRDKIEKLNLK